MAEQVFERVLYEVIDGNIAKVIMNRPEVRNAEDYLMLEEMEDAFIKADQDPAIRVIILAGAGELFSSGHDLGPKKRMPKNRPMVRTAPGEGGLEDLLEREEVIYYKQALNMRNVSKPTIAMVQGGCIAGAMINACMCDLIIASDDAYFWQPVLNRLKGASVEILVEPYEMGVRKAKEFIWLGLKMSAQEALQCGMVNRVVPRARLEEETLSVARQLAEAPPVAVRLTKKVLNHTLDLMGQRDLWDYHILMHCFSHFTTEFTKALEERQQAQKQQEGSLKTWLKEKEKAGI